MTQGELMDKNEKQIFQDDLNQFSLELRKLECLAQILNDILLEFVDYKDEHICILSGVLYDYIKNTYAHFRLLQDVHQLY